MSGFTDAEGCFHVSIVNQSDIKVGKSVRIMFQISLHRKDKALLHQIKDFFGLGEVIDRNDGAFYYKVSQIKDLVVLIKHFDIYPLLTEKRADFELFKQIVEIVSRKEHLSEKGLQKIVNVKASMNFEKLSENLKASFPNTVPVNRPLVEDPVIYDPKWVSGFVDGEGCFTVNVYKRKDTVNGEGVKLVFKLTQDKRNKELLTSLIEVFGCGGIYNQSKTGGVIDFMVTGFSNILEKVIPFFIAHPLQGAKRKELADFIKVAELMKQKAHLTKEGLEQIHIIKNNMNTKRL